MADVPQKEIPRLRYPEELSKESFERDFAAKSEPATWTCKDFVCGEFCVLHLFLRKWDASRHEIIIGGNFVSPFSTIKEANQSFHVRGEGHKPNSKGLSTHYKDSLSLPFSNHQTSKSKVIIEGLISDWPAFSDPTRTWRGDRWDSFMDEVDAWICLFFLAIFHFLPW